MLAERCLRASPEGCKPCVDQATSSSPGSPAWNTSTQKGARRKLYLHLEELKSQGYSIPGLICRASTTINEKLLRCIILLVNHVRIITQGLLRCMALLSEIALQCSSVVGYE